MQARGDGGAWPRPGGLYSRHRHVGLSRCARQQHSVPITHVLSKAVQAGLHGACSCLGLLSAKGEPVLPAAPAAD